MTTDDLLQLDKSGFINALAFLDDTTCEMHVRKLLKRLNGPNFEKYMRILSNVAVTDTGNIESYYFSTRQYFPDVAQENDILGRLCGLALKMMADRLERNRVK